MRRARKLLLCCAALLVARTSRADGPLPPNAGDPIRTSDYSVDLFQGPVLSTARVTALGGAYTAIAEGAEGIPFNPASASLRTPSSTMRVDWDLSGGITLPSSISGTDFDNNGSSGFQASKDFFFATLGGYVQLEHLSFGAMISLQNYGLSQGSLFRPFVPGGTESAAPAQATDAVTIRFYKIDPVVSYGFLDGQLHVGGGVRAVYLQLAGEIVDVTGGTGGGTANVQGEKDLFTNYAFGAYGAQRLSLIHI